MATCAWCDDADGVLTSNSDLTPDGELTSNGYVLDASPQRLGALEPVPDHERDDRESLWRRFRRDGYLYLPRALDPDTVEAFRGYYFGELAGTGLVRDDADAGAGISGDGDVDHGELRRRLYGRVVPGPEYAAFCAQPAIRQWYEWFLGGDVHLHRRKIIRYVRPGERGIGTATQAHYDLLYLRGGTDQVFSSWIPLGDCPVDRGGLVYLEGSHHRTIREERSQGVRRPAASITADLPSLAEEYDARWLVTDYAAGDMVVHSAYLVHAALDNVDRGGVIRLSTDIRYQRTDRPIDVRWQNHWHEQDGL